MKELRLNDNQITEIPETLRKCSALEIVDFGNNQIKEWKDIASLGSLLSLHNLNLKGNPIAQKKDYLEKVLDLIPSLRILDGERFDPKFLQRKKKQRQNTNLVEKKQRVKRMKLQKEKKERKTRGEDEDVEMKDVVPEKKRKIKEKDEPKSKKQKKDSDMFFVAPEAVKKPKVAEVAAKKAAAQKQKKEAEPKKKKQEETPKTAAAAAAPVVPQTKAQTGVVGVVDKSKKNKTKAKAAAKTDIVAALENEETQADTGTGLDVGGWD